MSAYFFTRRCGYLPYIKPELVSKAKEMDLLTYLKNYEPWQLVSLGGGVYCTKEHDSLKISNGKWCWWSRGIGGRSALDYLIKVQEIPFLQAVEQILGQEAVNTPVSFPKNKKEKRAVLYPPDMNKTTENVKWYLIEERGIDREIVHYCIQNQLIMETIAGEVAFIGYDKNSLMKCINLRSTDGSDFKKTVYGSDRRFAFRLVLEKENRVLHLYEGAIDLLSYLTLLKMQDVDFGEGNFLSLGGIYQPKKEIEKSTVPIALSAYLSEHSTTKIILHLDNDMAGRRAAETLKIILPEYEVLNYPPPKGKDYNDYLFYQKQRELQRKRREICR